MLTRTISVVKFSLKLSIISDNASINSAKEFTIFPPCNFLAICSNNSKKLLKLKKEKRKNCQDFLGSSFQVRNELYSLTNSSILFNISNSFLVLDVV